MSIMMVSATGEEGAASTALQDAEVLSRSRSGPIEDGGASGEAFEQQDGSIMGKVHHDLIEASEDVKTPAVDLAEQEAAAGKIQAIYRGHRARRAREQEMRSEMQGLFKKLLQLHCVKVTWTHPAVSADQSAEVDDSEKEMEELLRIGNLKPAIDDYFDQPCACPIRSEVDIVFTALQPGHRLNWPQSPVSNALLKSNCDGLGCHAKSPETIGSLGQKWFQKHEEAWSGSKGQRD
eukprot:Skav215457  [mRNA]  locus=scaffold1025:66926:71017:+ [translate_table: standard]